MGRVGWDRYIKYEGGFSGLFVDWEDGWRVEGGG